MDEKDKSVKETIKEELEKLIGEICDQGVGEHNIKYLGDLIDAHKDLENEEYWKEKIEMMYRGNYGTYSEGGNYGRRRRDSRGRYMESGEMYGNYGRRGQSRYKGHEMLEEMGEHYGRYSESKSQGGRYGTGESTKALEYMLQSAEDFFEHLFEEANGQEEMEMIKHAARKIAEM